MLAVTNISARYGSAKVLHDLTLNVQSSEVVVVLGANGAGKTTLLRAISGLIRATGHMSFDGEPISGVAPAKLVRRGIAHVPQGRGTFADMTVLENMELGGISRPKGSELRQDIDRWLTFFPRLADRRHQIAGNMSGGEQQMLAIARALMLRPKLLLLDEPSIGLSPILTQEVFGLLASLSREMRIAMLIVEQNAQLALDIAARAYLLETGRFVSDGPTSQFQENPELRRAYLGY